MTTASDMVTRAFRIAGLNTPGTTISGEDSVNGLALLNNLLYGWASEGIDLAHSTLTLDDTVLVPASYDRAIVYNLAADVAAEYGSQISAAALQVARDGRLALQARTLEFEDDLKVDEALNDMPNTYHGDRRRSGYNINEN